MINNSWILTKSFDITGSGFKYNLKINNIIFSCNNDILKQFETNGKRYFYFLEGHIIPRNSCKVKFEKDNLYPFMHDAFLKYGDKIIDYISGNFILIIISENLSFIFSDRFAVQKYFKYSIGNSFLFSNNLWLLQNIVRDNLSKDNIAVFALMHHFTDAKTIFENIRFNSPAEFVCFSDNDVKIANYWKPADLLNLKKDNKISIKDIAEFTVDLIKRITAYESNSRISLSLTGGADTRNLLASFLNLSLNPHLFTFGNPDSADCVKSALIAKGLKLEHNIYDIKMDDLLFLSYAKKIVSMGFSLTSIHRVHRLIAIEYEKEFGDILFFGTLGGEFIKGISDSDTNIIPAVLSQNWTGELTCSSITPFMFDKYININNLEIVKICELLNSQPYFRGDVIQRKLNALVYIVAHLHDAQDISIFNLVFSDVYTPFLDIDYLELIFSSDYSFNNKELYNNKFMKRIQNPVYASHFLNHTCKPLMSYEYSGEHKPVEVYRNKYLAAIQKSYRKKIRGNYPENFPLSRWMYEFVNKEIVKCNDYNILREVFDLGRMIKESSEIKYETIESYWLRFTNPIYMMYIIDKMENA